MALRKTKEEERVIDVEEDSGDEAGVAAATAGPTPVVGLSRPQSQRATPAPGTPAPTNGVDALDEDLAWAEEDPDDDVAGWKLKIMMEDDQDLARY